MDEDLTVVQTCGVCGEICDKKDVARHPCLNGYASYYTDPITFYFFPLCDDGKTIIRKSVLANGDEVRVEDRNNHSDNGLQIPKKKNKETTKLNYDQEETLISEVQKRELLWNYETGIQERDRLTIQRLWKEVSNELNGALTAEGAKNKFKSLHDTYRKIIRAEKCQSGSAKRPSVKKWHHYDSMEFLRYHCGLKDTVSNCTAEDDDYSCNASESNEQSVKGPIAKKRKNQIDDNSAINRIAEALNRPVKEIVLPPPPVPDEIDSCVSLLGCRLRRVPESLQTDAVQEILEMSYNILRKYYN